MRAWGSAVGPFGDVLGSLLVLFRSLPPSVSLEFVSSGAALTAVRREAFAVSTPLVEAGAIRGPKGRWR